MLERRRRRRLADASELYVGPQTKRFREVIKQIRQAEDAIESGKCMDAMMHLHEAHGLMQAKPDVGADTHHRFTEAKRRLKSSCRLNFAARTRRQRRW